TYRAGLVGITRNGTAEPIHKANEIEMYDIGASERYTLIREQIEQRKSLASRVKEKGFDNVIEEVAYTWFNRIIAVRFMEVNDYLPTRVRVLSSETVGKIEPDIVTVAPNIDLDFTTVEIDEILQLKHDNKLDELFRMLFIKQCNALNMILPELFEKISDYTELLLSISFTNEESVVRMLIDSIEEDDFKNQVEIIGWMYQYYNTELKDDTFAKLKANMKITKERIPAATQLFTRDWIVRYMVENSLGRLWLEGHPESDIKAEWKYYLDEAEQEPDVKVQLEKLREDRKNIKPEDIKVIDPCMGSGHILVYAFDVLMDIYRSCGYEEREAAKLILKNNLYGLDIDDRAYQYAYFAVMMKAREYSRRILSEGIKPNLCAIQESPKSDSVSTKELSDFFVQGLTEIEKVKVKEDFKYLIEVFYNAKEYGSILNVDEVDFDTIERRIEEIKSGGAIDLFTMQYRNLILEKILPLVKQAKIMVKKYDVVVTNPPYMGANGMSNTLSEFVKINYTNAKLDLFSCCIEKCLLWAKHSGYVAMITMESWMFLSKFVKFRKMILEIGCISNLIHMPYDGKGKTSMGISFGTCTFIIDKHPINFKGSYMCIRYYENDEEGNPLHFPTVNERFCNASTEDFLITEDTSISYWLSSRMKEIFKKERKLSVYAEPKQGLATSDNNRYLRSWYEVNICNTFFNCKSREEAVESKKTWFPCTKGGAYRKWYGNNDYVVDWYNDGIDMKSAVLKKYPYLKTADFVVKNQQYYFNKGITWSTLTSGKVSFRYCDEGFIFETKGSMCFVKDIDNLDYVLAFLNSKVAVKFTEILSPTMDLHEGPVGRIPLMLKNSEIITKLTQECISLSRSDWDSFETSWNFASHPLLKYRIVNSKCRIEDAFKAWKEFSERQFNQLIVNEEELNRIFIEIYGLQDELTPEVEEKDVTIRKTDLERDIKSFISYAVGCMLGRYSLDVDGLAYAGGEWDGSKYKRFLPDVDNIIPITDEEYFNDDIVGIFVEFVKVAFGADTLEENLDFIANALGNKGNTSREIIRQYFIKNFHKDHVKTYQKKPIYWLFDSGKENGFKALIYMHRYNQDTVGRVRADYLHKTQKAIESAISRSDMVIDSAANPAQKAKAVKEKGKLVKQLAETRIYDAAIGHIAAQRIAIDLDDGVAVNYAKFQGVEVSSEGRKASKVDLLAKV
ncbi:MAG: BREX-1 system adenine-specific DNA-methyltransferase PglX, partial [Clostridiaceae bacterium]|nr:BREX-1 system adenine-specific DNA-methyltransferase PglX [Clostridiaceae bacterium]